MSEKTTIEGNTNDKEIAEEIKVKITEASHDFIDASKNVESNVEPSKEDIEKVEVIKDSIKQHLENFESNTKDETVGETLTGQREPKPETSKENKQETKEGSEGRGLEDSEPGFLERFWTNTKLEFKKVKDNATESVLIPAGVGASIFGWVGKWYNKIKSIITGKPLPKK